MKDSVYAYILASDIKHPEIVLKQAILETGWFQSKMLMKKNNLFAFRSTKKYKQFDTWQASIDYYKKWQDEYYTNPEENYYTFLKRKKYAHTPEYIRILKNINLARSEGAPLKVQTTTTTKTVKQTTTIQTKKPPK
ncbi:MAG TPA: glucosaminidase domain-containing protein [Chitinophagales bacterium]|nr:glucosaminidase domain-containing protein [Chitinophagales bacterium]